MKALVVDQWVSCRYGQGKGGIQNKYYNALITGVSEARSAIGAAAKVKLTYVFGESETDVDTGRVRPPHVWAVGETASVLDRGCWWQGTVAAVNKGRKVSENTFEVTLAEQGRSIKVAFNQIHQDYGSGGGSVVSSSTGCPGGAAAAAPAVAPGGRGRGRGRGGLLDVGGGRGAAALNPVQKALAKGAAKAKAKAAAGEMNPPAPPRLHEGAAVKYLDKMTWCRGKVKQDDGGDTVEITTHDTRTPGKSKVVVVKVPRKNVQALGGPSQRASSVLPVLDSQ